MFTVFGGNVEGSYSQYSVFILICVYTVGICPAINQYIRRELTKHVGVCDTTFQACGSVCYNLPSMCDCVIQLTKHEGVCDTTYQACGSV